MDIRVLARYSRRIEHVMDGTLEWEMNHGINALVENQEWELMSVMILTASEVPARRMAERLAQHEQYLHLILPACFRRQIRKPQIIDGGAMRRPVFRDLDALDIDQEEGIPEHIRQDAEEMSDAVGRSRMGALQRELQEDNDGIRDWIITALGEKLMQSADAVNALVLVACCSMFEDSRRMAALKIANHAPTVRRMVGAGRASELVQISQASGMESVAINISRALSDLIPRLVEEGNTRVLRFIADNHPEAAIKQAASEGLPPEQA